jgi:hypothetical protein
LFFFQCHRSITFVIGRLAVARALARAVVRLSGQPPERDGRHGITNRSLRARRVDHVVVARASTRHPRARIAERRARVRSRARRVRRANGDDARADRAVPSRIDVVGEFSATNDARVGVRARSRRTSDA